MSASAGGQRAAKRGEIGLEANLTLLKSPRSEIAGVNSRHGGCCADGMDVSTCSAVDGVGP